MRFWTTVILTAGLMSVANLVGSVTPAARAEEQAATAEPPKATAQSAGPLAVPAVSGVPGVPGPYPMDVCPVSGGKLGAMGKPFVLTYEGQEVKLCCPSCETRFRKDPKQYLKKIEQAVIEQEKANYPLKTCVVSNEALDEKTIDLVYQDRLYRVCCTMCVAQFKADPAKYTAKLNEAVVEKEKASYPLEACPISGEKLGHEAVDLVVGDHLVRLCCPKCVEQVKQDPAACLAKLDAAESAAGGAQPATQPAEGEKSKQDEHAGHGH
ncbi:MAG: hypothetical protein IT443_02010 [Phycisphaeraceae bacterium]|nr:hypothetical protein [Phycisphaeraceae bacterium]